eukprot:scaffold18473_cov64-Cyclotella_meneghiniana.AAC.1
MDPSAPYLSYFIHCPLMPMALDITSIPKPSMVSSSSSRQPIKYSPTFSLGLQASSGEGV